MNDNQPSAAGKGYWVWGLVILLIILHQDNWNWHSNTLVFGFVPIGLVYHACISIGAAVTWFLATKFAWPDVEEIEAASTSEEGA